MSSLINFNNAPIDMPMIENDVENEHEANIEMLEKQKCFNGNYIFIFLDDQKTLVMIILKIIP